MILHIDPLLHLFPHHLHLQRTPSSTSDDSPCPGSSQSLELDLPELDLPSLQPHKGKPKGKNLNPFALSSANPGLKSSETPNQVPNYLLQLAKNKGKDRKEKKEKKKKSKGGSTQTTGMAGGRDRGMDVDGFRSQIIHCVIPQVSKWESLFCSRTHGFGSLWSFGHANAAVDRRMYKSGADFFQLSLKGLRFL